MEKLKIFLVSKYQITSHSGNSKNYILTLKALIRARHQSSDGHWDPQEEPFNSNNSVFPVVAKEKDKNLYKEIERDKKALLGLNFFIQKVVMSNF
jgi:formylmethanofuran dehydrogenase subunit E-like metal-binding protein